MAGVTSTAGHHFELVGRVGDSPIIGAGPYVDNNVGEAGAIGHSEESIKICASFLGVEKMREGMTPLEACRYVCQRVVDRHQRKPMFTLKLVALDKQGAYGCCSVRGRLDGATKKVMGVDFSAHDTAGHLTETG